MTDFEYLLKISQVLTSSELDNMTQLSCIQDVIHNWTLNLKLKKIKVEEIITIKESVEKANKMGIKIFEDLK